MFIALAGRLRYSQKSIASCWLNPQVCLGAHMPESIYINNRMVKNKKNIYIYQTWWFLYHFIPSTPIDALKFIIYLANKL